MTFIDVLQTVFGTVFSGTNLAILGAALAVAVPGIGSAKGVGMVSESAVGLFTEQPEKFGKALIMQALPATQGIYGFVVAFMVLLKIDALSGNPKELSFTLGMYFLLACLPIVIGGYASAIRQARVSATGINLLAKRPEASMKAVISAALVEMYAILAFLISLLLMLSINV